MDKRGIGHEIDWIISAGLFILSITFIFILFKPGVTPVYDSQTLLDIAQDGFNKDVVYSITKTPLFLTKTKNDPINFGYIYLADIPYGPPQAGDNYYDKINNLIASIQNEPKINYMKIIYIDTARDNTLPEEEGNEYEIEAKEIFEEYEDSRPGQPNSEAEKENEAPYRIIKELSGDNSLILYFEGPNKNKKRYTILTSDNRINFKLDNNFQKTHSGCYAAGEIQNNPPEDLNCPIIYELGASEKATGVNLASFFGLEGTNNLDICGNEIGYECVKKLWRFPQSREFKIKIDSIPEAASPTTNFGNFGDAVQPSNVNVFVRSYNDYILTYDGTKIPVKVTISTW